MSALAAPLAEVLPRLRRAADAWSRRGPGESAALATACSASVAAVADEWVACGMAAKGWTGLPIARVEEWAGGPLPVARLLRLCAQWLAARAGGRIDARSPWRAAGDQFVCDALPAPGLGDRLLLRGHRARLVAAEAPFAAAAAARGGVALVLGAGNLTATPLLDTIDHALLRGRAVVLKPSPLHTGLAPVFARALAPLVQQDLVHVVTGDGALGSALAAHPDVTAVHLTGSVATATALRDDPAIAAKELTTELGCCTPALVVPGRWRARDLQHVATQLACFAAWNGGATCVAPRVVLTARGWPQRAAFLHALHRALAALPAREPFHPGARAHYAAATLRRAPTERLPPVLRDGLDPERDAECLRSEPFAPVLLEVPLPGEGTADWLDGATGFVRERVFGALSAYVWAPPPVLAPERRAIDAAVRRLPHGTVAINTWTGLGYGLGTPWGVPPAAPWPCGRGWARDLSGHPTLQRVVLEGPFRTWPPLPWSSGRTGAAATLRALTAHYAAPSAARLAAVAFHACR